MLVITVVGSLAANLGTVMVVAGAIVLAHHVNLRSGAIWTTLTYGGWVVLIGICLSYRKGLWHGLQQLASGPAAWRAFIWIGFTVSSAGVLLFTLYWLGKASGIK